MAFCSNCGNDLRIGANFCPKCGTAVGETKTVSNKEGNGFIWKISVLFVVVILSVFLGTRFFAPNMHCTLFKWFPYYESPSVVAYKYLDCIKEGNTVEMLNYTFTSAQPSRAKMEKVLKEKEGTKEYKDAIEGLRMLLSIGFESEGGIKDFSIESEEVDGDKANVKFNIIRKSGIKDTETIHLQKDENGAWGIKLKFD